MGNLYDVLETDNWFDDVGEDDYLLTEEDIEILKVYEEENNED